MWNSAECFLYSLSSLWPHLGYWANEHFKTLKFLYSWTQFHNITFVSSSHRNIFLFVKMQKKKNPKKTYTLYISRHVYLYLHLPSDQSYCLLYSCSVYQTGITSSYVGNSDLSLLLVYAHLSYWIVMSQDILFYRKIKDRICAAYKLKSVLEFSIWLNTWAIINKYYALTNTKHTFLYVFLTPDKNTIRLKICIYRLPFHPACFSCLHLSLHNSPLSLSGTPGDSLINTFTSDCSKVSNESHSHSFSNMHHGKYWNVKGE